MPTTDLQLGLAEPLALRAEEIWATPVAERWRRIFNEHLVEADEASPRRRDTE